MRWGHTSLPLIMETLAMMEDKIAVALGIAAAQAREIVEPTPEEIAAIGMKPRGGGLSRESPRGALKVARPEPPARAAEHALSPADRAMLEATFGSKS